MFPKMESTISPRQRTESISAVAESFATDSNYPTSNTTTASAAASSSKTPEREQKHTATSTPTNGEFIGRAGGYPDPDVERQRPVTQVVNRPTIPINIRKEEDLPILPPRFQRLSDKIVNLVKNAESKGAADRLAVAIAKMDLLLERSENADLTMEEFCNHLEEMEHPFDDKTGTSNMLLNSLMSATIRLEEDIRAVSVLTADRQVNGTGQSTTDPIIDRRVAELTERYQHLKSDLLVSLEQARGTYSGYLIQKWLQQIQQGYLTATGINDPIVPIEVSDMGDELDELDWSVAMNADGTTAGWFFFLLGCFNHPSFDRCRHILHRGIKMGSLEVEAHGMTEMLMFIMQAPDILQGLEPMARKGVVQFARKLRSCIQTYLNPQHTEAEFGHIQGRYRGHAPFLLETRFTLGGVHADPTLTYYGVTGTHSPRRISDDTSTEDSTVGNENENADETSANSENTYDGSSDIGQVTNGLRETSINRLPSSAQEEAGFMDRMEALYDSDDEDELEITTINRKPRLESDKGSRPQIVYSPSIIQDSNLGFTSTNDGESFQFDPYWIFPEYAKSLARFDARPDIREIQPTLVDYRRCGFSFWQFSCPSNKHYDKEWLEKEEKEIIENIENYDSHDDDMKWPRIIPLEVFKAGLKVVKYWRKITDENLRHHESRRAILAIWRDDWPELTKSVPEMDIHVIPAYLGDVNDIDHLRQIRAMKYLRQMCLRDSDLDSTFSPASARHSPESPPYSPSNDAADTPDDLPTPNPAPFSPIVESPEIASHEELLEIAADAASEAITQVRLDIARRRAMEDDEFIMEPPDLKRIGKVALVRQTAITVPTAPPSSPISRSPAFDENDDGASNEASHPVTSFFADDSSESSDEELTPLTPQELRRQHTKCLHRTELAEARRVAPGFVYQLDQETGGWCHYEDARREMIEDEQKMADKYPPHVRKLLAQECNFIFPLEGGQFASEDASARRQRQSAELQRLQREVPRLYHHLFKRMSFPREYALILQDEQEARDDKDVFEGRAPPTKKARLTSPRK